MDNQPPKRLKHQLVHLDHNLKAIERERYAGIQRAPDSLPVLEAFQAFLDQERQRMRRRLVATSIAFLLLVGLAGAAAIGITVLLSMRVADQQRDIELHRQDIETRAQALAAVVTASGEQSEAALAALAQALDQARREWRDDQAALERGQTGVVSRIDRYDAAFDDLSRLVESLRQDNAELAERLETAAAALIQPLPAPASFEQEPAPDALAEVRRVGPLLDPIAVTGPSVSLSIVPQGSTHPVRWLMPTVSTPE